MVFAKNADEKTNEKSDGAVRVRVGRFGFARGGSRVGRLFRFVIERKKCKETQTDMP
jgi:hypothetical protein